MREPGKDAHVYLLPIMTKLCESLLPQRVPAAARLLLLLYCIHSLKQTITIIITMKMNRDAVATMPGLLEAIGAASIRIVFLPASSSNQFCSKCSLQ